VRNKAPVSHPLAQHQQFDRIARIAAMGHHAVERCEMLIGLLPFAIVVSDAHVWAVANGEFVCPAQPFAGPLAFDLDFRVFREFRMRIRPRQSEINRVAIVLAGKSELQADRVFTHQALDRLRAGFHGLREFLRAGPQCRL
jgi:hypothetical protein